MAGNSGPLRIGVLALQRAVEEHLGAVQKCDCVPVAVKYSEQLKELHGLIIPGGESTTLNRLIVINFARGLKRAVTTGRLGIYGTCAGLILMASKVVGGTLPQTLGLMNITVQRNAFGRQVESFETELAISFLGRDPVRAVFIRAPLITSVGSNVSALAVYKGKIVFARQDKMLASAFHPELTDDLRIHQYFCQILRQKI